MWNERNVIAQTGLEIGKERFPFFRQDSTLDEISRERGEERARTKRGGGGKGRWRIKKRADQPQIAFPRVVEQG